MQKYRYMTGGSRSRFFIGFALDQLKSNRKSGYYKKFSNKPESRWAITAVIGQKADSQLEDYMEEGVSELDESESEEVVDYLDSYESSPSDDDEGTHTLLHF